MNKWDTRFLELAALVATWSKDPSSHVGAVVVDAKNRVVSLGYNGPPRGLGDYVTDRETKLKRTIHAEENALLFASRPLEGCTIYVTHPPCASCAAKIIQAGIARVVAVVPDSEFMTRWEADLELSAAMFKEASVSAVWFNYKLNCQSRSQVLSSG